MHGVIFSPVVDQWLRYSGGKLVLGFGEPLAVLWFKCGGGIGKARCSEWGRLDLA